MLQYHGRAFIAGVALAFKLLELVAARLADGELVRGKLQVVLGVNGPGIIDGIEMATRARSHGALTVNQQIAQAEDAPDAADGQGGKYYFEFAYGEKKMTVILKEGLIPQEFLDLAYKTHAGTISVREAARLQQLKEEIAQLLMTMQAEAIFNYTVA
jgi:hypothetical protein